MSTLRRMTAALGVAAAVAGAFTVATVGPAVSATTATPYKVPPSSDPRAALHPGQELTRGSARNLLVGSTLPAGTTSVAGTATAFALKLQDDGNLVEYIPNLSGVGSQAVWSTRTTTATRLIFQTDHNVVLRDAAGHTLWTTGTQGTSAASFSVYGNGQLMVQDATGHPVGAAVGPVYTPAPGVLVAFASSPSGRYILQVQDDGNLVEYLRTGTTITQVRPVWSSGTSGNGAVRLAAQSDGNLVAYSIASGRVVWNSHSHGPTGYYQLDVQDDANVVLYRTDGVRRLQAVWASYTHV